MGRVWSLLMGCPTVWNWDWYFFHPQLRFPDDHFTSPVHNWPYKIPGTGALVCAGVAVQTVGYRICTPSLPVFYCELTLPHLPKMSHSLPVPDRGVTPTCRDGRVWPDACGRPKLSVLGLVSPAGLFWGRPPFPITTPNRSFFQCQVQTAVVVRARLKRSDGRVAAQVVISCSPPANVGESLGRAITHLFWPPSHNVGHLVFCG